jgi:DNA-binding transcriptional MocR family regulator
VAHRSTIDDSYLLQKKEEEHAYLFQYGITSGLWEFREELAKFLSAKYGDKVHRYINIYCRVK